MEHTPFTVFFNEYLLRAFNQYPQKAGYINLESLDRTFRHGNMYSILAGYLHPMTVHCHANGLTINDVDATRMADRLMLLHHTIIDRFYAEGTDKPLSTLMLTDTVYSWVRDNNSIPLHQGWLDAVCVMIYNLLPDVAINNCFWVKSIHRLASNPTQDNIVACKVGIDWLSSQGNSDTEYLSELLSDLLDEVLTSKSA